MMSPEQERQILEVVAEALEHSPQSRCAFLEQNFGNDTTGLAEAQSLLAFQSRGGVLDRTNPTETLRGFIAGALVGDRFRIVRFIGQGGMGQVYEVEDMAPQSRRPRVALKTIRAEIASNPRMVQHFEREIEIGKTITHPNVCRIYDLGLHRDDSQKRPTLFVTMELLDGMTLAEHLRRQSALQPSDALPILSQITDALHAAHQAHIVHRDLKPGNIMLVSGVANFPVRAVVTDFGLARQFADADCGTQMTMGAGTPDYMSPEQINGNPLFPASDIYSLGVVAYQMMTGRLPFEGEHSLVRMVKRLHEPPVPPRTYTPSLPKSWEAAILRCLEREPSNRFTTALDFAHTLQQPLDRTRQNGQGATSTPNLRLSESARGWMLWIRRRTRSPAAFATVAGLGLLVAIMAGLWLLGRHHPSTVALRWYEEGTRSLRDGTSFTAMKALERAVQLDGNFTLAHARLAEAATELDYMDKAKSEMLRASPPAFQAFFLSSEERLRLEAVYFVLMKDFDRATAKYKELAAKVASVERAGVLVDLGRAYEGAGRFQDALTSYTESIKDDSQYASAFLRRGVLEARQQQNSKAVSDLDTAEQLYRTQGKAEGLTEVLYQRSSLLRRTGRLEESRVPTQKALDMARAAGDEYHEIRALLALSYLSYSSGDANGGQQQAQEAIDLARRSGIDVLAASGLVDVGNALFNKGDYAGAEPYLRNALETAKRFQALRIEARAELTLGQVLLKDGHTQEALTFAKQAIEDFHQSGDKSSAARAAIPAARMLRDQGEYEASANLFRQQLQVAEQVKDQGGIALAAQGLGSALLLQEQYPAALASFVQSAQQSRGIADRTLEAYSEVNRAEALWRLGRYAEAAERLRNATELAQLLNGNKPLTATIYFSRAGMSLSQQRFPEAEEDIRKMMDAAGPGPFAASGKRLLGLLRVATGRAREAQTLCEESVHFAQREMNIPLLKNSELALAEAKLYSGDTAGARLLAPALAKYFETKGQNESELRALTLATSASQGADRTTYRESAKVALDRLRQSLGRDALRGFMSRPDIRQLLQRTKLTSDI